MGKMKELAMELGVIDYMVVTDQRDRAVRALEEIEARLARIIEMRNDMDSMSLETIMAQMAGAISVSAFLARSAQSDIKRMNEQL